MQIRKEEIKLSLFADDMILCFKNPKNSTRKLLDLLNAFSKVSRIQNQHEKPVTFYTPIADMLRKISGKKSHLQLLQKIPRNKLN
jgi:hypothetical protein